jgi:hypothetical protein
MRNFASQKPRLRTEHEGVYAMYDGQQCKVKELTRPFDIVCGRLCALVLIFT